MNTSEINIEKVPKIPINNKEKKTQKLTYQGKILILVYLKNY